MKCSRFFNPKMFPWTCRKLFSLLPIHDGPNICVIHIYVYEFLNSYSFTTTSLNFSTERSGNTFLFEEDFSTEKWWIWYLRRKLDCPKMPKNDINFAIPLNWKSYIFTTLVWLLPSRYWLIAFHLLKGLELMFPYFCPVNKILLMRWTCQNLLLSFADIQF